MMRTLFEGVGRASSTPLSDWPSTARDRRGKLRQAEGRFTLRRTLVYAPRYGLTTGRAARSDTWDDGRRDAAGQRTTW